MVKTNREKRQRFRDGIEDGKTQLAASLVDIEDLREMLVEAKLQARAARGAIARNTSSLKKVPPEEVPSKYFDIAENARIQSEKDRKAAGQPPFQPRSEPVSAPYPCLPIDL